MLRMNKLLVLKLIIAIFCATLNEVNTLKIKDKMKLKGKNN